MRTLPASSLLLLAAVLPAQQVHVSASAVAPMVVEASLASSTVNQSQPAGPLPFVGLLQAETAGFASTARANWSFWASTQAATFDLDLQAVATLAPGATATSGEHEVLVHFSSSVPLLANLELTATLAATAGNEVPLARVDVFDDGIAELTEASPAGSVALALGPSPVPVRVRARIEAGPGGVMHAHIRLRLVPDNRLVIGTFVSGCTFESALTATPSFVGTGVDFRVQSSRPQDLHVLALGLAAAPLALPPLEGLPCILLPRLDVLIPMPLLAQIEHVSIPPAVHPLLLFAQAARLDATGIHLTEGLLVNAF